MDQLSAALVPFLVGLAVGGLAVYLLLPARRQQGQLRKERDEAAAALTHHREEVDAHFLRTAELVNQLTSSYRAMHDHLSGGARTLCTEQGRRLAMAKTLDSLPGYPGDTRDTLGPVTQPLDYAPEAQGTLAEDYGLRQEKPTPVFAPVDDLPLDAPLRSGANDDDTEHLMPPRDYADGCDDQGCSPNQERKPESTAS